MAKKDYSELAKLIMEAVGGKSNVSMFQHCVTRLRFNLKDESIVDKDGIDNAQGVMGSQFKAGQYQVIIGGAVNDVYDAVCRVSGIEKQKMVEEKEIEAEDGLEKKKLSIGSFIDGIAGCIVPAIPLLAGAGLIKALLSLMLIFHVTSETSAVYNLLYLSADAAFSFLPVVVGGFAAKKFGGNMGIGMLMGAMLMSPTFVAMVDAGESLTILGYSVPMNSYSGTVFPAIITVFVMCRLEKLIAKHTPDMLKYVLPPFLAILIMIPLAFGVLAPVGSFVGSYLAAFIMFIYNHFGFLGVGLLAAVTPFLIMTSMHTALIPFWISNFMTLGYEPICDPANYAYSFALAGACLAHAIWAKNKDEKGMGMSAALTATVAAVTEPGLFGLAVKYKNVLTGTIAGGFIGGCAMGIMGVKSYVMTTGILCFVTEGSNFLFAIIALAISFAAGFVCTFALKGRTGK